MVLEAATSHIEPGQQQLGVRQTTLTRVLRLVIDGIQRLLELPDTLESLQLIERGHESLLQVGSGFPELGAPGFQLKLTEQYDRHLDAIAYQAIDDRLEPCKLDRKSTRLNSSH